MALHEGFGILAGKGRRLVPHRIDFLKHGTKSEVEAPNRKVRFQSRGTLAGVADQSRNRCQFLERLGIRAFAFDWKFRCHCMPRAR
jgi:hypothetical protein